MVNICSSSVSQPSHLRLKDCTSRPRLTTSAPNLLAAPSPSIAPGKQTFLEARYIERICLQHSSLLCSFHTDFVLFLYLSAFAPVESPSVVLFAETSGKSRLQLLKWLPKPRRKYTQRSCKPKALKRNPSRPLLLSLLFYIILHCVFHLLFVLLVIMLNCFSKPVSQHFLHRSFSIERGWIMQSKLRTGYESLFSCLAVSAWLLAGLHSFSMKNLPGNMFTF